MGVDVIARAPEDEEDKYFQCRIWEWPYVLDAIARAGVLPDDLVLEMGDPMREHVAEVTAEQARALADAMQREDSGSLAPVSAAGDASRNFVAAFMGVLGNAGARTVPGPVPGVRLELIPWFAQFARSSGGFGVY
jgi:hypothetical protein